mmetsp:Transcript_13140/g.18432  ORF Transcript_13140/g.18432 Transcript_13140/m.18432 type:complete len:125 (-) Transcript_13140:1300-1674(-)
MKNILPSLHMYHKNFLFRCLMLQTRIRNAIPPILSSIPVVAAVIETFVGDQPVLSFAFFASNSELPKSASSVGLDVDGDVILRLPFPYATVLEPEYCNRSCPFVKNDDDNTNNDGDDGKFMNFE